MLPMVVTFNMLRNNDDNDVNLENMLLMASKTEWKMDTPCGRLILECKLIEAQHLVRR
jgi:hypothetical protein